MVMQTLPGVAKKVKVGNLVKLKRAYKIKDLEISEPLIIWKVLGSKIYGFPVILNEELQIREIEPWLVVTHKNNVKYQITHLRNQELRLILKEVYQNILKLKWENYNLEFMLYFQNSFLINKQDIIVRYNNNLEYYFILEESIDGYTTMQIQKEDCKYSLVSSKIEYLTKDQYYYDVLKLKAVEKKKINKLVSSLEESLLGKIIYVNHEYLYVLTNNIAKESYICCNIEMEATFMIIQEISWRQKVEIIGSLEKSDYYHKLQLAYNYLEMSHRSNYKPIFARALKIKE